jgi:hypothetical protein
LFAAAAAAMILNAALSVIAATHEFDPDLSRLVVNGNGFDMELLAAKDALWKECGPILADLGFKWVNRKGNKQATSTFNDIKLWLEALSKAKAVPVIAIDSSELLDAADKILAIRSNQTNTEKDETKAAEIIITHNETQQLPTSVVTLAHNIIHENEDKRETSFETITEETADFDQRLPGPRRKSKRKARNRRKKCSLQRQSKVRAPVAAARKPAEEVV